MSSAIHSEVVELVLSVEKFERQVARTSTFMDRLRQLVEKPMEIVGKFDKVVTEAKALTISLNEAKRAQEQLNLAMIAGQMRAQEQMKKTQRENKILVEEMVKQGVPLPGGQYRGTISAVQLSQLQRRMSEQDVTNELRKQLDLMNRQAAAEKLLVEETKRRALAQVQSTIGYRVGSTVLSGRTGALMTAAASGSFLMGASNLGAMFYMMERLSYATGVGHQNLSVFAEKLGLVKLTGDGAEASIARFGRGLVVLGGAAAAAAAAFGTMFAGNRIDKALANMSTLLADASVQGEKFSSMMTSASYSANQLSKAFGEDLVTVIDGFRTMLSTGINADELEKFGTVALNLSKGLNASFQESISILTTFKDAFAGTVEDSVEYSDVLFNAINVGKFNVAQLNANVGRVAVTAAEAGVSFKDMMAALATLNRVGMSTSQAITSLNQMIVSITNPTDKAKASFDKLGIGYGSAALRGRSLLEVIEEIKRKVGDNADLYGELFGEERGRRGAIGLAANPTLFQSNRDEMEKTGTAAAAAARAMDTFGQNIYKVFLESWNVIQQFGEVLLDVFNMLFKGPDTNFEWADALAAALATILTPIGGILTGLAAMIESVNILARGAGTLADILLSLIRGDFSSAKFFADKLVNDFSSGLRNIENMVTRFGKGVGAIWAGIFDSDVDTVQANKKIESVGDAFTALMDSSIRDMVSLQEGVSKQFDTLSKKSVSSIQAIAAAQRELAKTAFINEFNKDYLTKNRPTSTYSADAEETSARAKLVEISMMEANGVKLNEDWVRYRAELEKWVAAKKRSRDEAYAQDLKNLDDARKKALAAALAQAGFTAEAVAPDPGKTASDIDATLQKKMAALTDTMAKLDAISSGNDKLAEKDVKKYQDALTMAEYYYTQVSRFALENAGKISKADQDIFVERMGILDQELVASKRKIDAAIDARYLAEHNRVTKLYNEKMKLYDREEKRLDKLGERLKQINEETFNKLKDIEYDRRGAGFARRDLREQVEGRVRGLEGVPLKDFEEEVKQLNSLIERMVSFAEQDGAGGRAKRDAEEFYRAIQIATAQKERARANDVAINEQRKEQAVHSKNTDLATNEAIRAEAMDVVKQSLAVAASHGIGITGGLAATVDVGNISANLPVSDLKRAIKDAVVSEMSKYFKDKLKGNENDIDGNMTPPGGDL